jgi:O-antigen/teichoic acid export membrane protein
LIADKKRLLHFLKNNPGIHKYLSNISWMLSEQVLRLISGLFVGIWVARFLGPEQFGIFNYVLAFVAVFSSVAKLGLDSIVVRNLVNEPDRRDAYLGTAFWLKISGALSTLFFIAFATWLTNDNNTTSLYILIIASGMIFQSFEVIDFYFQSKVMSKFVSLCKVTQLFISSLLKIYFVLIGADLFWFVVVSLIDQVTLAVALYYAYRYQKIGNFYRSFNWSVARSLLKDSWPLILSGVVLMIQARVDQLMIKDLLGNTELGYYSSALRLVEVFSFIPVILTTSLFPAIVNAKRISATLYESRMFNLYRLMMFLFLIIAIPISIFGDQIITFMYKDAYAPAGALLSIMVMRLFFTNFGVVRGAYLMTENLMSYSLVTMTIGTIVNVILNYYWIPSFHSIGAIWASLVSFLVTTFLIDFYYSKTRSNFKVMIRSLLLIDFTRNKQ